MLQAVLIFWLCVSGSRLCSGLVDRSGFPWIKVLARGSEWLSLMVVLANGEEWVSTYQHSGFLCIGLVGFGVSAWWVSILGCWIFGLLWVCFVVAVDLYYFIVGDILFYCVKN